MTVKFIARNHPYAYRLHLVSLFSLMGIWVCCMSCRGDHDKQETDYKEGSTGQAQQIHRDSIKEKVESNQKNKFEIRSQKGSYQLFKGDSPFFIKGVAGRDQLEEIKKAGGNTIRTWSAYGMDTLLDQAYEEGLHVLIGLDIGKERLGFDYGDSASVQDQFARVKQTVSLYKSHPATLGWIIGNEVDLYYTDKNVWTAVNDLSKMIHEEDGLHPTSTACIPDPDRIRDVISGAPDLDFITCNVFGKLGEFPELYKNSLPSGPGKPYLVGEWSGLGFWETYTTDWNAPVEPSPVEKVNLLRKRYKSTISRDSTLCLGACVFYWGTKQERTHTWFSMFLEGGEKTPMVDVMYDLWGENNPINHAPFLSHITLDSQPKRQNIYLQQGQNYYSQVKGEDPDGDSLTYSWEILPEGNYQYSFGGDQEARPNPIPGLFIPSNQPHLSFNAPTKTGAYRLFVYAFDGYGNGVSENIPFFVQDISLK